MDYAGYYYFTNINSITGTMNSEKNLEVMVDEMFARLMGTHCQRSEYENQILSYVYITHIINTMINYNRGCGIKRMKEKYQFCFDHLEEKFPNYRDNPYIGIFKPKGQSLKIRFAVTFVMTLKKYGLDKMFFEALAVCPF